MNLSEPQHNLPGNMIEVFDDNGEEQVICDCDQCRADRRKHAREEALADSDYDWREK